MCNKFLSFAFLILAICAVTNPAHASPATDAYEAGCSNFLEARFFKKAIQLDPKFAKAYIEMARSERIFDESNALSLIKKAIALDPDIAESYEVLGDLYQRKGKLPRALSEYSHAIKLDPQNASFYEERGDVRGGPGCSGQLL